LLRGRPASARPKNIYRGFLAGLLLCLPLTLLTVLDIRRGFLFTDYAIRSSFYVLHGLHAPLLAVGVLGILICLTRPRTLERRIPAKLALTAGWRLQSQRYCWLT
jgi:heme/copper-type cytochrome/quinol oxidase subunit 3